MAQAAQRDDDAPSLQIPSSGWGALSTDRAVGAPVHCSAFP